MQNLENAAYTSLGLVISATQIAVSGNNPENVFANTIFEEEEEEEEERA